MSTTRRRLGFGWSLALLLTLVAAAAAAPTTGSDADLLAATAVARAFYEYHFGHDMGFTEAGLRARSRWLAPALYRALLAEARKPKSPDEVPLIDGDPFTDSQEYPSSFRIGAAGKDGHNRDQVLVDVAMVTGTSTRLVRLVLARFDGRYQIVNFIFPGGSPDLIHLLARGGH
ncbi:MAG TPA: hypothetical protein VHR45_15090 [Thermoanaerobaculia bacterium]|nr:hypothetical protein [Thermoanaerobaculia bacterium]